MRSVYQTFTPQVKLFSTVKYRFIWAWSPKQCIGYSPRLIPLGYCDLEGATHNPKGRLQTMFVPVKSQSGEQLMPIPIKRRELHRQQEAKGGKRSRVGGTVLGQGLVKNTLIRHVKYGLTRLAGINAKGLFSIYSMENKRFTTSAKRSDFRVLTRLNFYYRSGHSAPS